MSNQPSIEIQNSIIHLIKEILTHYEELDSQSSNETKYYCHTEFDSNVTEFEGLSNCNKIMLKTKLNTIHIPGLMRIFQAIYDNNYNMFETKDFAENIYCDCDRNIDNNDLTELMSYNNVDTWLELLDLYNNLKTDLEKDSDEDLNNNYVGNERFFDIVPTSNNSYNQCQKRQKIYTIGNIKQLLDE